MKLAVKRTLPRGFILAIAMHDGGYVHLEQGAVQQRQDIFVSFEDFTAYNQGTKVVGGAGCSSVNG